MRVLVIGIAGGTGSGKSPASKFNAKDTRIVEWCETRRASACSDCRSASHPIS